MGAQDYTLRFPSNSAGTPGQVVSVGTGLQILPGAEPVSGWSFGICHDATMVRPIAASLTPLASTINNGSPVEIAEIFLFGGDAQNSGGVMHSAVICVSGCATLPSQTPVPTLINVDYEIVGQGVGTVLEYCEDPEIPGAPASISILVTTPSTPGGLTPALFPGLITFSVDPAYALSARGPQIAAPGNTVEVTTELEVLSGVATAFSYELCHDFSQIRPISAVQNVGLDSVNLGNPPDFQAIVFDPGSPAISGGVVHSAVICILQCAVLPAGLYGLLDVEYEVVGDPGEVTEIGFCTDAVIPNFPDVETIVASAGGQAIDPILTSSSLSILSSEFRRGDANDDGIIDVADVVRTAEYLFSGGEAPPCLDAADANDDGSIDVADAVRLVQFVFQMSAPLPTPGDGCGTDPTDDSLPCFFSDAC